MQKIFTRYLVCIITLSMLVLLIISFFLSGMLFQFQQKRAFKIKLEHIEQTIRENNTERKKMEGMMERKYLMAARMLAFIIEKNPSNLEISDMVYQLARLLDVDELNISDEKGIIRFSSKPRNMGFDFHSGRQSQDFLPLLNDNNKDASVIQDIMPNTLDGKMMKYIAVQRPDQGGIVQVGLSAERFSDVEQGSTYPYIFSHMLTDSNETFFAVDGASGLVVGDTNRAYEGFNIKNAGYSADDFLKYRNGGFITFHGVRKFMVVMKDDNILLGADIPAAILYREQAVATGFIFILLAMIGVITTISIRYLVDIKIIDGIHKILLGLDKIRDGKWTSKIAVTGNPELEKLSIRINSIIDYVLSANECFTKTIDLLEIPLAAFRCQMGELIVTAKFSRLLGINKEKEANITGNEKKFLEYLSSVQTRPLENEKDIYQIDDKYIKFDMMRTDKSIFGIVYDVTADIIEKRKVYYESRHDPLTGLCTYQYFQERVQKTAQENVGECMALVMMDLDRFKEINDTKGHDAGDSYIKHTADFMRTLPEQHRLLCRRSGDEFCICFYGFDSKEQILSQLKMLWEVIGNNPVPISGETCYLRISAGLAWYAAGDNFKTVMANADKALYYAKNSARGTYKEYIADD